MPSLIGTEYRREFEIHRYPLIVSVLVPLVALVLQSWMPRALGPWALFDLPLVITIYFALGRRSPIQGTILGAFVGLFEDALTHHAIGLNGVAKTVVGFLAASVGLRIEVDNHLIRVMLNFVLSLLASCIYFFVAHFMLGLEFEFRWISELIKAADNAVIALILFPLLDRLQVRE
jgi:rod shape-determining protein MreD